MAKRNNAYWQKRMEALEDEQYRRAEAYYRDVQEQFYKASDSIQRDIERWYQRLADNNGISYASAKRLLKDDELKEFKWTVEQYVKAGKENALDQRWMKELENASAKFHINRLQAMKLQIQQHAELLFTEYEGGMTEFLQQSYGEQFYRTAYEISRGTGVEFNLARIDERKIDALSNIPGHRMERVFQTVSGPIRRNWSGICIRSCLSVSSAGNLHRKRSAAWQKQWASAKARLPI